MSSLRSSLPAAPVKPCTAFEEVGSFEMPPLRAQFHGADGVECVVGPHWYLMG